MNMGPILPHDAHAPNVGTRIAENRARLAVECRRLREEAAGLRAELAELTLALDRLIAAAEAAGMLGPLS